jgi:hypothetical protein
MQMLDDVLLEQVAGGRRPAEDLGQKQAPNEGEGGGGTWAGDPARRRPSADSPFRDLLKDPNWLPRQLPPPPPPLDTILV